VEQASVDRFGLNALLGKKGFEWVLAGGQERDVGSSESGDAIVTWTELMYSRRYNRNEMMHSGFLGNGLGC